MKTFLKITFLLFMTSPIFAQNSLLQKQLKFERVKNAYDQKWAELREELSKQKYGHVYELFIAAYKSEGKLEIWLKKPNQQQYSLFRSYDFCEHSGTLGPKLIEGDGQTPEGFYTINVFNPESSFHLSLGVDYPNSVDLARTGKDKKPGGDIYIHGNCVTVGCIPLTDEKIKEVYLLTLFAKSGGQKEIPVYIFPFKMTDGNLKKYSEKFPQHTAFWGTLQMAYKKFAQNKTLPNITQVKGTYVVK